MSADPTEPLEAAQRANRALRERVAELEMQLKRFNDDEQSAVLGGTLAERQALLDEAGRMAHLGTWVWDTVTNEVWWSSELFRILGYDPARDASSTDAFFERVHPEDRQRVREVSASGLAGGTSEQADYRVLRPDGSVRHVTMDAAMLFGSDGKLRRAVGTVLDLTESKEAARESKKAAQLLADAQRISRIGSFEVELATQQPHWSAEMFRIMDVPVDETPSFELFLGRLHPDDRERIAGLIEGSMERGHTVPSRARVVRRDGRVLHVDMRAEAVAGEQGELLAVRGTVNDVTELVQLEAQFHQSQKMEAIGQLAGGLAHDYNNLLTVILGNAELLLQELDRPELHEISSAAATATTVTNRLLTFSRQGPLNARVTDLNDDVDAAQQLVRRALGDQIVLTNERAVRLRHVLIDSGQVQQMLLNLALNARDAMPQGGTLAISTQHQALTVEQARDNGVRAGDYVTLTVEDSGHGMDEATRDRVFEPFFTTKQAGHGTGLGWAMVFGAMKQNGGFVEVSSTLGKGTTFRLWFPCVDVEPTRASLSPQEAPRSRASILLVEDNEAVARVTLAMLKASGYRVRVASSAREALAAWQAEPADLLLTDVVMPETSGLQLAEQLRVRHAQLLVLFITGYSAEHLELEDSEKTCSVLSKPFRHGELVSAIEALLASRRA